MVIVFELIYCRQSNSFSFHSPPGFGSVEKNFQHKTAQKPEEKQEKDGKPETKTEAKQPETESEKEVVIPATVEKVPTKTAEVSPYADVADSIAAARTVEFANAQALADVPNQTSALVQVKVSPVEAMLAAQAAEAKVATEAEVEKRSPNPTTTQHQSPSDSGDWTIVDNDVEKSSNASAAAAIGARPKCPPQQLTITEKTPLHPGKLLQ